MAAKLGIFGEKAAKVGKFLGGAQVIIAPALAILEEYQENKYQEGIKDARIKARNQIFDWCEEIRSEFNNKKKEIINQLHNTELISIEQKAENLRDNEKYEKDHVKELQNVYTQILELINSIKD